MGTQDVKATVAGVVWSLQPLLPPDLMIIQEHHRNQCLIYLLPDRESAAKQ